MPVNSPGYPRRPSRANITPEQYRLIQRLRERNPAENPPKEKADLGSHLADLVASTVGSWKFVIIQSICLGFWIFCNVSNKTIHWDSYPFILLNLMLSFQAAYTAPIIMMSQNRQNEIDRQEAKHDHEVNLKSELEIELLHDKINLLREAELSEILHLLRDQQKQIDELQKQLKAASIKPDPA